MVDEPWELSDYPLWHGMAPMSTIVTMGSPSKLLVRGDGCWVEDAAGRRYLDARAGICNVNLGYGRRDIAEAIYRQALDMPFGCIIRFERPAPVTIEYARALVEAAPTEPSPATRYSLSSPYPNGGVGSSPLMWVCSALV